MAKPRGRQASPPPNPDDQQVETEERIETAGLIDEIPDLPIVRQPGTEIEEIPPHPVSRETETELKPTDRPPEVITKPLPVTGEESDEELEKKLDALQPVGSMPEYGKILRSLIKKFRGISKETQTKLQAAEKERDEFKEKIIPDDEINRLRETEKFVATRAVEHLPRWRQYDEAINTISEDAASLLQTFNVKPPILKVIKDRGGIIAFSRSDRPAGGTWKNGDGTAMSEAQWFEAEVFKKLTDMQKAEFTQMTASAYQKQREKTEAINKAKENATQTLTEESERNQHDSEVRIQHKTAELIKKIMPDLELPMERPKDSPETATEAEKAQTIKLQKAWDDADAQFTSALRPKSIEEIAENSFYACLSKFLIPEVKTLRTTVKDLTTRAETAEKKLADIKDSRSTSRLRNAPPPERALPVTSDMTDDQAMEAGLPK